MAKTSRIQRAFALIRDELTNHRQVLQEQTDKLDQILAHVSSHETATAEISRVVQRHGERIEKCEVAVKGLLRTGRL